MDKHLAQGSNPRLAAGLDPERDILTLSLSDVTAWASFGPQHICSMGRKKPFLSKADLVLNLAERIGSEPAVRPPAHLISERVHRYTLKFWLTKIDFQCILPP